MSTLGLSGIGRVYPMTRSTEPKRVKHGDIALATCSHSDIARDASAQLREAHSSLRIVGPTGEAEREK